MMIIFLGLITLLSLLATIAILIAPAALMPTVSHGLTILLGIFTLFFVWCTVMSLLIEDSSYVGVLFFAVLSAWFAGSTWVSHRVDRWM